MMRGKASIIILLFGALLAQVASAEPDRDSLIAAWEAYIAAMPGTSEFELLGDGVYRLHDTDLPYEGELRVVGALVRSAETAGFDTGFTHLGMVEFELAGLPDDRLATQSYYYWLADRQSLHYSSEAQEWLDPVAYQESLTELYAGGSSFGALSFMLNYGIWVLIIGLLVFAFIAIGRQAKKARALMDETAAINQQARKNLDRAEGMQDKALAIAQESRDLQSDNNELLKQILSAIKR